MASKGDISLDVEDFQDVHGWPHLTDLTTEDIQYSVHLPLTPQSGIWPSGDEAFPSKRKGSTTSNGVMRVLNIVVPESRLLASRERCPFLIHVEVVDSGIEGHDARLYAAGRSALGSTVEEAIGINRMPSNGEMSTRHVNTNSQMGYKIPPELLEDQSYLSQRNSYLDEQADNQNVVMETNVGSTKTFPRGGWQHDDYFPDHMAGGYFEASVFEEMRQQQYEQLHHQMQQQPAHQPPHSYRPRLFDRYVSSHQTNVNNVMFHSLLSSKTCT